ncbi:MAG: DNA-3-methyladenine glycosylase 2 family protein [Clostridiales bacterium]|nr:DNA-3-methyladenine glycosylase 2 family protein [Clostridiales bacterium]
MNKTITDDGLLVGGITCFNEALTLDCGQAFRWSETNDGWHGVAFGKPLTLKKTDDGFLFSGVSEDEFNNIWNGYFDFDTDYAKLCDSFMSDEYLKKAVECYPGIRILNQDTWEALCSFIISQNNNIPRIKGIISRLCENFGEPLGSGDFAFPSADRIAALTENDLAPLRSGFRAKYILDAARKVACGEIRLDSLKTIDIDDARYELMKIKGVGPKVAECTLLYGCGRKEAFPVDVWVKRIMGELYPSGLPECVKGYEGVAQQYLFHWRRTVSADNSWSAVPTDKSGR